MSTEQKHSVVADDSAGEALTIRFTAKQLQTMRQAARLRGMKLKEWIREVLYFAAK
jgi:predicted DNA binding CopG/RHH family protein